MALSVQEQKQLNDLAIEDNHLAIEQLLQRGDLWRGDQVEQQQVIDSGFSQLNKHLLHGGWPAKGLCEVFHASEGIGELTIILPLMASLIPAPAHNGANNKPSNYSSSCDNRYQSHRASAYQGDTLVSLVSPPHIPYPEALAMQGIDVRRLLWVDTANRKDQLWALEQIISSGVSPLTLCWLDKLTVTEARRIQFAAEKSATLCVCYLPEATKDQAHPVHLRVQLSRKSASRQACSDQRSLLAEQECSQGDNRDDSRSNSLATQINFIKRRGGWPVPEFNLSLLPPYLASSLKKNSIHPSLSAPQPSFPSNTNVFQGPWSG